MTALTESTVKAESNFEAAGNLCCALLFVWLFALSASSRYKNDTGALLWLNAETLEERPPPSLTDL